MIGIDTNVLVRYIMQDEPKQSAKAGELIESLDNAQPGRWNEGRLPVRQ